MRLMTELAEAVGAARVDGGGVLPPAGSNQLVETVAEVLDLTGPQHTPHPHHVAVAPGAPSPAASAAMGMATTPRPAARPRRRRRFPRRPVAAVEQRVERLRRWPGLPVDASVSLGDAAVWGTAGSGRRQGGRVKPLWVFEGSGCIEPEGGAAEM